MVCSTSMFIPLKSSLSRKFETTRLLTTLLGKDDEYGLVSSLAAGVTGVYTFEALTDTEE